MIKENIIYIDPFIELTRQLDVLMYRSDWNVEIYSPDKFFGMRKLDIPKYIDYSPVPMIGYWFSNN